MPPLGAGHAGAFPELPFNSTPSTELIASSLAEIEQIRSKYPQQTLSQCRTAPYESIENLEGTNECGLARVVAVQLTLSRLQAHYQNFTDAERKASKMHKEYGGRKQQLVHLRKMLRAEVGTIKTVCEIGFNAGHGTSIWLEGTDVETVHSFDLLTNPWSTASATLVKAMYPGRFYMYQGDSVKSVARWNEMREPSAPKCDLWLVDGKHTGREPIIDMRNALASSRNGTTMIADDCHRHYAAVLNAWQKLLNDGSVRHPETFVRKHFQLPAKSGERFGSQSGGSGFCAGVVVKP